MCTIFVHDGRVGRDPALVHDGRGEVLMTMETDFPTWTALDVGSTVTLPDGSQWPVIGCDEIVDSLAQTMIKHLAIGTA